MGRGRRAAAGERTVLPVRAGAAKHDRGGVQRGREDAGEHARRSHGEADRVRDGEDGADAGGTRKDAVGGAVSPDEFRRAGERIAG